MDRQDPVETGSCHTCPTEPREHHSAKQHETDQQPVVQHQREADHADHRRYYDLHWPQLRAGEGVGSELPI